MPFPLAEQFRVVRDGLPIQRNEVSIHWKLDINNFILAFWGISINIHDSDLCYASNFN